MHRRRAEEGQVIVIIALSIVVIIGMTALAIDGSRYYADRRESQAAADSAALAGAGAAAEYIKNYSPGEFYCGSALGAEASTKAILAAINNAAKDGVTLSADPGAQTHVKVTCDTDGFRKWLDIQVQVTSATELSFGKVITNQPLVGQVEAVTRVYPQENLAFGNAIASLAEDCDGGGIYLDGGSEIKIYDGGVFSNSCLSGKGNISLVVSDATIAHVGEYITTGGAYFDPAPVQAPKIMPVIEIDPPDCSSLTVKGAVESSADITPGIYPNIRLNAGNVMNMAPGLYCLDGDFSVNGAATINGTNVTIYMRSGQIDLTGTSSVNLSAPNCTTSLCGVPPAIRGILFFVDPSNTNPVKFAGTATSSFMGTIYAPSSEIVVTGTSDVVTIQTQMIGQMVSVTGNVKIELNLDGAELYQTPSSIELRK